MSANESFVPDIRIEQNENRVILSGPDVNSLQLSLQGASDLQSIVTTYARQMEKARPLGLPGKKDDAQQFLSLAKNVAYRCITECVWNDYDTVAAAFEIFERQIAKAAVRGAPLLVEIANHSGQYLPWEWVGDRNRGSDHMSEARTVLGFCAVVYRRAVRDENQEEKDWTDAGYLDADPKLPLRFFRNPELDGAQKDYRNFRFHPHMDMVGPLPEKSPGGRLTLAEDLVDPFRGRPGPPLGHPDQVVHLSCHHGVKGQQESASAYELLLSKSVLSFGKEVEADREITVSDLGFGLASDPKRSTVKARRPLVFLSVCRGDFHPFTTNSVADVILRNGNRGVISTAVKIPDDSAAELAKFFYDRLLDGDCTAAEALLFAKWSLLRDRVSPCGLLYSYYGSPSLRAVPVRKGHAIDPLIDLWSVG